MYIFLFSPYLFFILIGTHPIRTELMLQNGGGLNFFSFFFWILVFGFFFSWLLLVAATQNVQKSNCQTNIKAKKKIVFGSSKVKHSLYY